MEISKNNNTTFSKLSENTKFYISVITWINRFLVGTMLFYYLSFLINDKAIGDALVIQFFVGVFQVLSFISLWYIKYLQKVNELFSVYLKLLGLFFLLFFLTILLDELLPFQYDFPERKMIKFSGIIYPVCVAIYYTYMIEYINRNKNTLK